MNIKKTIEAVEKKWLLELLKHNKKIFSDSKLLSHDDSHHSRVWDYSKKLLAEFADSGIKINSDDIEKLILAVFFHDTGMVEESGPKHGYLGKEKCKKFLNTFHTDHIPDTSEIYEAIEKHDDKEYLHDEYDNLTLHILSIADDLDALGAIGVLRYFEIYYLREIPICVMPSTITSNLKHRYKNMIEGLKEVDKNFLEEIKTRYQYITQFYASLMDEITTQKIHETPYKGFHGILSFYKELCIENDFSFSEFIEELKHRKIDNKQLTFINQLENELKN